MGMLSRSKEEGKMEKVMDWLEDQWNEVGIIPELYVIEEELDGKVSFEDHASISEAVERFISFIRPEEGVILFQTKRVANIG